MQLYEVSFQVHYQETIDLGKILVCARDKEHAIDTVRFFLGDAPSSQATFEATRLKPSIYQLDRREIHKHREAHKRMDAVHRICGVDNTPPPVESSPWVLGVTAGVRAMSESAAWIKLGKALLDKAHHSSSSLPPTVSELEMTCEQAMFRPKPSAFEKQAIYKSPRFVAGGAARPR